MIKIQKSKPNRHKIYLLENCPSSINNREVLICNDYIGPEAADVYATEMFQNVLTALKPAVLKQYTLSLEDCDQEYSHLITLAKAAATKHCQPASSARFTARNEHPDRTDEAMMHAAAQDLGGGAAAPSH